MSYKYHPMHMHLHAACDYGASMALDMYNASKLGMKYIWFTDHDTRMGIRENCVDGFSFDTPSLMKYIDESFYGFETLNENIDYSIDVKSKTLSMDLKSEDSEDWTTSGIKFLSKGTLHTCSLSSDVTLSVEVKDFTLTPDSRLVFVVKLSQRPPDMKNAYMLYVVGENDDLLNLYNEHIQTLSAKVENGMVTMPVSSDVSCDINIGGRDNAFDTLYILLQSKCGKECSAKIGDFKIERKWICEELKQRLQKSADEAGKHYGVKPFVTTEISGAGEHKNCYGTNIPIIDYKEYNYNMPEIDAIEHVKKHNGIYAINHPFAIKKLKKLKFQDGIEAEKITQELFENIKSTYKDASLIEVGFPEGRNFPLSYYLRLWDMLSLSGMFLTGYGSSDCHRNNIGWFDGNNFCTYIGVDPHLEHPICEKEFVDGMKKGRVYTADPVRIKGNLTFETENMIEMGSVISFENKESVKAKFSMNKLSSDWTFKHIKDGEEVVCKRVEKEDFEYNFVIEKSSQKVRFHRMEIWDEKGRCILITNPIYAINKELLSNPCPEERLHIL